LRGMNVVWTLEAQRDREDIFEYIDGSGTSP
jgi:plasmid stabilization system protein ParE